MRRSEVYARWLLSFFVFSVGSAFCQAPPPVSFGAARAFETGPGAFCVAVSDFNGDGKPDVAVANLNGNNLSVLLGNGDGTFQAAVNYAVGSAPYSVAVGDFNGDGKPDLALANSNDGTVSVLLGNGDGTFQAAVKYAAGTSSRSVSVGDFDGDGKADLAVVNHGSNNVSVLLGKGDGTFQAAVNYAVGTNPESVAVGDFNGDGKPDLAVANTGDCCQAGAVSLLLGKGDGTFQMAVNYAAGAGSFFVTVGDLNVDGRLDLVVVNIDSNNVSVLLGNGDGTFQGPLNFAAGTGAIRAAVGDFNGDGKPDLAVVNNNGLSVLRGNGDGTFQPPLNYAAGAAGFVAVGDLNGDGKPDLVVSDALGNAGYVSVFLGNGDGTFDGAARYTIGSLPNVPNPEPISVAVGDFNGDGKPDLAVASYFGVSISVLLGNGDGTFQPAVDSALGGLPASVAVGDFNGDGKPDLVVAGGSNNVSVLLGKGDGTFRDPVNYAVGLEPNSVAVGDFNGDGKPDVAVANIANNNVSVLLGKGDGTFRDPVNYAAGSGPTFVAVGDFDGDGKPDLVLVNSNDGTVSVLLGNGDGTFRAAVNYGTGADPRSVAVSDFNGDGKLDLAVANSNSGRDPSPENVSVLLGNGDGTFQAAVNYAAGRNNTSVAVGDFNGDGRPDLAVANASGLSVLVGMGDGTFQAPVNYAAGLGPDSVAVGDFNGDSKPDLAVANMWYNVTVMLSNTPRPQPAITLSPTSVSFTGQIVGTTSAPQSVTVTNTGTATLGITAISITGANSLDFAQTNDCPPSVAPQAGCIISVTFRPGATGSRTGSITITDYTAGSPQTVSLSGTGVAPVVSLTPPSLTFSSQLVGTASLGQSITLSNSGTAALTISSIAVSGDFAQTSTCGSTVSVNATCTITATFTPGAAGTRVGSVTIADNASDTPQMIGLSGTAILGPRVQISPASLSFPAQFVGTTGLPQNITLTNSGDQAVTISNVQASNSFGETSGCTTSLAQGVGCTIGVFFDPTASGNITGNLTITDNAPGSPHTVSLAGTGQDFNLAPASSSSTTATVVRGQAATYTLTLAPGGGFNQTVSFTCAGAPAQSACNVSPGVVTLSPTAATSVMVTVTTTAPSMIVPRIGRPPGAPGVFDTTARLRGGLPLLVWIFALALLMGIAWSRGRRVRSPGLSLIRLGFGVALLFVVILGAISMAACGGGGSGGGGGGNPGTPAGTYNLNVTGTFASGTTTLTHNVKLILTVN